MLTFRRGVVGVWFGAVSLPFLDHSCPSIVYIVRELLIEKHEFVFVNLGLGYRIKVFLFEE